MKDSPEQLAISIVRRLREAGHEAYFAGGCVRDMLRGEQPKDYDVATAARPEEVQALFRSTYAVGAQFGVIVVREGGRNFEVATFRNDGAYVDGRRPDGVTFSSPREDAQRRDFTINGLFFDPIECQVIDFVGGQEDLKNGLIRAIGQPRERFSEDKLRILRAIRFAARFGFEIEPGTWRGVCEFTPRIQQVSPERVREELTRIFLHPNRARGLDLLSESGLLAEVLPEVEALKGCEQPPQFHPEGDVYVHTRLMLSHLPEEVSVPLVWSVLLHDIGKPATFQRDETGRIRFNGHDHVGAEMARELMKRLRFSNAELEATVEAVDKHMVFKDVRQMRPAKLRRFMARPHFEDELELHRVDCLGSSGRLENYEFLLQKQKELEKEALIPPPLLTGNDLRVELGWTPGPLFGEVLEEVQTRQLEGELSTREEALAWARENYAERQTK